MNTRDPWLMKLLKETLDDDRARTRLFIAICGQGIPANQANLFIKLVRETLALEQAKAPPPSISTCM